MESSNAGMDASCRKERPSTPTSSCSEEHKRGGMTPAVFIMAMQSLELMAIAGVGNNLITYVLNEMHYSLPNSANIVTNFVGTIFLLSIVGGFLSDSYLGSFLTIIIFGIIELIGYIILGVQAHIPSLKPHPCDMMIAVKNSEQTSFSCEQPKGVQALVLFLGLYTVALGSGCVKPNMIAYGGDQFEFHGGRRIMSTYFNLAYLSFCVGQLIALTLLVWIQKLCGMDVGFWLAAGLMLLGLLTLISGAPLYRNRLPQGSIFISIVQVLVAATLKSQLQRPSDPNMLYEQRESDAKSNGLDHHLLLHTDRLRFLDRAAIVEEKPSPSPWKLCTVRQVEQVKLLIRVIPIFGCTIVTNCVLAQLQTFSVQQGTTMDARFGKFHIPPASLQAIPYILLIFLVPMYDTIFVPFARRITGKEAGISQLERIGVGLFISTLSMVAAALVETKRKHHHNTESVPLSIFWIAPQFLIFGFSEMFTAVGMIDFFYSQSLALPGMQSFLTALTYCSYSSGFFLSSALVSIVNKVTNTGKHGGWLSDNNLNKDRLDLFYWLLSALSFFNLLNYVFWWRWYIHNPGLPPPLLSHFSKVNDSP